MEIVTECGTSILSAIVEDLVKSTGRQVGYIFRFKRIIEDLNKEAESLRSAQVDMQSRVDIAIKNTEEIDKKVEDWRRDVTAVVADAEDLKNQTREMKTCLNGLCPNLIWRYQMARRAQKKIGIMLKLKDDGDKFDNIAHRTALSGINVLTPKDFMPFGSTTNTFDLIIEALKDDKTNVVGLYGMGGVGKTTLAKAVRKKAKEEKTFNEVVMVAVSQTPNVRDIQDRLADLLNLELKEKSREGRAARLYMRLKVEKKILIILDDIWEKIELADIGIPVDDCHKDCKIFLTTRREQVCIDMGCLPKIPLNVLNEEEGLVLFKRHSGLNDDQSPTMIKLAKEVVKECKDFVLPTKLLRYDIRVNDDDNEGASYPKSRLLKIRGIETTSLVAFKALYEKVEYLELVGIKGCCQNMVSSIDETGLNELKRLFLRSFDELECIVGPTQQVSLQSLTVVEVESCNKLRYLFTLSLARSLLQLEQLNVWYCPSLEHIVKINEAEENVGGGGGNDVMFPRLRKLQLGGLPNFINFYSENSSLNLRTAKEQLRGLNLWRHGLQNLKELKIRRCRWVQVLFQLEGVEQELSLPSLKVLELSGLEELECLCMGPTHLLSLPNLKKLEVYGCKKLRHMFSPSLARNLLQLEELSITGCGELEYIVSIKAEENVGGGGGNDVMLPKLRILELYGVENFINFFDSENLSLNMQTTKKQLLGLRHGLPNLEKLYIKGYRVQVLFHLEGLEQELAFPSLKVLVLYNLEELECLCKGPTHLLSLPNLKKLEVYSCNRMRHMFSPSLARNLLQLEELTIWHCEKLEYIVSIKAEENVGGGGGNDVMLPKLRILRLSRVENFIDFCSENSSLNVQTTKKQLRGLRHGLQNLEELDISECRVQVLFHLEGLEQELAFSSLKVLKLYDLKELECLCKGLMHLLSLPKLKELSVYGCNRLRHMFSPSLARNFKQLEELIIENCGELEQIFIEDDAAEYHPTLLKDHLQWPLLFPNLSSIFIKRCDKLKTLFPAVITARSGLQKPKTLIVGSSSQLEELFGHKDEADMTSDKEMVLPQLQKLTLQELASLVNFCPVGYHFIFPSLSRLFVTKCLKITTRFSIDQNRSVHAEAETLQTGKEDVDMEQSPPEITREIKCWNLDALRKQLPQYIRRAVSCSAKFSTESVASLLHVAIETGYALTMVVMLSNGGLSVFAQIGDITASVLPRLAS
ncbi:hypothetical protein LWI29_019014 [Acer saccharum]|uniref:AAA+ ATPase domain-containing protein n=1 Tax=Acer saccharum TaxID=4024 RepID=A0AA39T475_ACESA|nr:hypothetical protein LWI29_019014 [Acer saccharum]